MPSTDLPWWLRSDPMAVELARCGQPIGAICDMIERAAILEQNGMTRQAAEATVSGGETYSH